MKAAVRPRLAATKVRSAAPKIRAGAMRAPALASSWHSRHWSIGSWHLRGALTRPSVSCLDRVDGRGLERRMDMGLARARLCRKKSRQRERG